MSDQINPTGPSSLKLLRDWYGSAGCWKDPSVDGGFLFACRCLVAQYRDREVPQYAAAPPASDAVTNYCRSAFSQPLWEPSVPLESGAVVKFLLDHLDPSGEGRVELETAFCVPVLIDGALFDAQGLLLALWGLPSCALRLSTIESQALDHSHPGETRNTRAKLLRIESPYHRFAIISLSVKQANNLEDMLSAVVPIEEPVA